MIGSMVIQPGLTMKDCQKVSMHVTNTQMNRRMIPAEAVESIWHAADQWAIRRIDWQGANPPRGS
jgi:hypothetical protein